MKTLFLTALFIGTAFSAFANGKVLLEDNFENGFSKDWLEISKKGVEIVPEDPAKPDGNKVARITAKGYLATPPAKAGDVKTAKANEALFDVWSDYELTFRFKIHPITNKTAKGSIGTIFIDFRISPSEEVAWAGESLWICCKMPDKTWALTPMLSWDGRNIGFDRNRIQKYDKKLYVDKKIDSEWHTVKIRCQGERAEIYLDGNLFIDALDDHFIDGGVTIHFCKWGNRIDSPVDIDDVKIVKIEE